MVERRSFIDRPLTGRESVRSQLRPSDGAAQAILIELEGDNARVYYPWDSTNEVVAPAQPGLYPQPGGMVQVLLTGGRVAQVMPPLTVGGDAWGVGDAGSKLLEATTSAYVDEQLAEAREEVEDIRDNLQNSLDSAQATANQAAAEAADAKGKVQAAHDAAMNAVEQVQGAVDAAAEAAGIAAGKANVLIQDATPSEEYCKDTTLWIDTTGGANDPKRWDGTAWVSVGDGKLAQAAADAANAAKDAELAMTAADGKSKITYSATTPSKPNTGDRWYNSTTGLAQIWDGTAWVSTAPGDGFVPALDIGKATVGDMEVGRLTAQASTFASAVIEKLIADEAFLTNLYTSSVVVPPYEFPPKQWGDPLGTSFWPTSVNWTTSAGWVPPGLTGCLRCSSGTGTIQATKHKVGDPIPVQAGDQFEFEMWIRADKANSRIYIELRDQNNALLPASAYTTPIGSSACYLVGGLTVPTGWTRYTSGVTIPAGVTAINFGSFYFNHSGGTEQNAQVGLAYRLRRKTGAVLIEDGAITTPKLNVTEEMSAAIGKFLKVTTDQLVAGSAKIAGELIADELTGKTLTGGTIQTVAAANRGVKIDSNGLHAWDASGTELIRLSNDAGSNILVGKLYSNLPGLPGMILVNNTSSGNLPGIWFSSNGGTGGSEAAIYPTSDYKLIIRNRSINGSMGPIEALPGIWCKTAVAAGGSVYDPTTNITESGIVTLGSLTVMNQPTSTSAANCVWAVSPKGRFYLRSSLRRDKLNIRPVTQDVDPWAILNLPVVDWFDRTQTEERAEALEIEATNREAGTDLKTPYSTAPLRRIPGVVAEDVEAAGLGLFCEWDGSEVRGVQYERLPLLLIPIVKEQQSQIEALQAEMEDLKSRIERLEADK